MTLKKLNKPYVIIIGIMLLLIGIFYIFFTPARVKGISMEPTYHEGDLILVSKMSQPHEGDVVIAQIEEHLAVKRVGHINEQGDYYLLGDNQEIKESNGTLIYASKDSRVYGYVAKEKIKGVVLWGRPKEAK